MRVAVLHVLSPTADIDIILVTVGQRAVHFVLFGPPIAGCWGISTVLSIPLLVTVLSNTLSVTVLSIPLSVTVLSIPLLVSISLAEVWTEGSE